MSESSLDVFQLLLQLSDTMLDLNNQLSAQQNASRLLTTTNLPLSNLNYENEEEEEEEEIRDYVFNDNKPAKLIDDLDYDNLKQRTASPQVANTIASASSAIEDFLHKAVINSTSTVSNVINQLNRSSISSSSTRSSQSNSIIRKQQQQSSAYKESSVAKFVDSLFGHSNSSYRSSSNCSLNTNIYQSIDEAATTTPTTITATEEIKLKTITNQHQQQQTWVL